MIPYQANTAARPPGSLQIIAHPQNSHQYSHQQRQFQLVNVPVNPYQTVQQIVQSKFITSSARAGNTSHSAHLYLT